MSSVLLQQKESFRNLRAPHHSLTKPGDVWLRLLVVWGQAVVGLTGQQGGPCPILHLPGAKGSISSPLCLPASLSLEAN